MKAIVATVFLLFAGLASADVEVSPRANINAYVDLLLKSAEEYMKSHGYDPMQLPDFNRTFSAEDLLGIRWHGELIVNNGTAFDTSSIFRSGDVDLSYVNSSMVLTAEMGFRDIEFNYNFSAKVMNIGPTGYIFGRADNSIFIMNIIVDLKNRTASLLDFQIKSIGQVNAQIHGLGTVLDWMANAITKTMIDLFRDDIIEEVESVVHDAIKDVIGGIDVGGLIPKDNQYEDNNNNNNNNNNNDDNNTSSSTDYQCSTTTSSVSSNFPASTSISWLGSRYSIRDNNNNNNNNNNVNRAPFTITTVTKSLSTTTTVTTCY